MSLRIAEILTPEGLKQKRECVEHGGAVAMVALLDDGSVLLNRQHRYASDNTFWEIPAGTLEKGEKPRSCARRELIEETGYKPGKLVQLTRFYPTPGYSSEIIYVYLATNLKKVDDTPIGHTEEGIRNEAFPFEKVLSMINTGKIEDGKTIIGILLAKEQLKKS